MCWLRHRNKPCMHWERLARFIQKCRVITDSFLIINIIVANKWNLHWSSCTKATLLQHSLKQVSAIHYWLIDIANTCWYPGKGTYGYYLEIWYCNIMGQVTCCRHSQTHLQVFQNVFCNIQCEGNKPAYILIISPRVPFSLGEKTWRYQTDQERLLKDTCYFAFQIE